MVNVKEDFMTDPCNTIFYTIERGSEDEALRATYAYDDRNGNGLVDPNELVCKTNYKAEDWEDLVNSDGWKWNRLGNAASFYKKLIAGYSRTSEVKPHEADDLFREFSGKMVSGFYDQYSKRLERAEASHKKNAKRDLDLFVRRGILDFIMTLQDWVNQGADTGWAHYKYEGVPREITAQIEAVFDAAEKNGMDVEKYYAPLRASLQKTIERLERQSRLQGRSGSPHIDEIKKLIEKYNPASPTE